MADFIHSIRNRTLAALCLLALAGGAQVDAAEAIIIGPETLHKLPHGKEVDAIFGDYLLRSDKLCVGIGGVAEFRDANVNTQAVQGAVLDLSRVDLPGGDNDLLTAYYPQGHYLDSPARTTVELVKTSGPEVVVRFSRAASAGMQGDPVDVMTEYTLRDGEPFLRIRTTYRNPGGAAAMAAIYDKIRADTLFRIPPAGVSRSLLYYEPWHRAAYAVVRAGAAEIQSYANPATVKYFLEGGNRLDFPELLIKDAGAKPIGASLPLPSLIPAHGSVSIERYLIPGRHPADVQPVIAQLMKENTSPLPVRVTDEAGHPVSGAIVEARHGTTVVSEGWTDGDGRITLALPRPEATEVRVSDPGRAPVTITSARQAADVKLGPKAQVMFDIVDVSHGRVHGPAKIVLRGVDGTPDPDLGPDHLPLQAGRLCFTNNGAATVTLPPGKYEALIGRGAEHTLSKQTFQTAYGKTVMVHAEIRRAFESPGWVMVDFHNHTTNSNDSIADPKGRVIGIAASGIEFAPATEHNRISTFEAYIEQQHLTPFLHSAGGIELSGRPGPGAINHQNAFPLRVQHGAQGGGAPRTDKDPAIQIRRLFEYDNSAEKYVQQNHPDIGWLYFDKDRDGKLDGGFGTRPYTHAMEVNREIAQLLDIVANPVARAPKSRIFRWLQMLNQGDRIYATATSDAHVTSFNNGSIFTYLRSGTDDPAQLEPLELARSARSGRMVLSNGPFMEVSLNGALPGGDVRAGDKTALRVRVQCAPWIDIDRVQVLVNGEAVPALNFTRAAGAAGFRSDTGAVRFEQEIPLHLSSDAHVIVVATGEHSQLGPFNGTYAKHRPTAMSNPVFVDVDGNGFRANRDTLGLPLPSAAR